MASDSSAASRALSRSLHRARLSIPAWVMSAPAPGDSHPAPCQKISERSYGCVRLRRVFPQSNASHLVGLRMHGPPHRAYSLLAALGADRLGASVSVHKKVSSSASSWMCWSTLTPAECPPDVL